MRFLLVLLVVVSGLFVAVTTRAQTPDAAAQPPAPKMLGQATMAGPRFYRPGSWGVIGANLSNPTDQPAEMFFTSWIQPASDLQFGRRVRLPARSRMRVTHPIFAPSGVRLTGNNPVGEVQTLVIDERSGMETRAGRGSNLLVFNTDRPSTAHVSDPTDDTPGVAVVAARLSRDLSTTTSPMRPDAMPTEAAALDVVDVLVISHRSPNFDADQFAALRGWINNGGHLWIMLDRVDPAFGQRLLLDDWGIDVVDDVRLNAVSIRAVSMQPDETGRYAMRVGVQADGTVTFNGNVIETSDLSREINTFISQQQSHDPEDSARLVDVTVEPDVAPALMARVHQTVFSSGGRVAQTTRSTDQPVMMRRVIAEGMEPLFSVDDWPVILRRSIGHGEVYVTTIDPDALLTGRNGAMPPLRQMAGTLIPSDPARDALPPSRFSPYVSSQIGYTIAGRGMVALLLLALVAALVVGALVLMKWQRLEWLAPLGAVAAVMVTVGFIFLGLASRQSQPLTMASGGLVEVLAGQRQASYSGRLSVYSPEPMPMQLQGDRGGLSMPEMDMRSADVKRLIWTDRHHWSWTGLELRSGDVKSAHVLTEVLLAKPVMARFSFDEDGAVGTVDGSALKNFSPQFVVNEMLHARLRGGDSQSRVAAGNLLGASDYSSGALQDAAGAVKQNLVEQIAATGRLPQRPMVIGWTDRTEIGTTLPDLSDYRGASLVTIPVTIEPPAADAAVTVPAVFVSLEAARPAGGGSLRRIFGMGGYGWPAEVSDSQPFTIRFKPPAEVLPLTVTQATIEIDARAPSQQLTVIGYDGVTEKTLATIANPSGRQTIVIDDPSVLRLDDDHGVLLTFRFRSTETAIGKLPKWTVERLGLTLQGRARTTSPN